jgi:hypothetical protein
MGPVMLPLFVVAFNFSFIDLSSSSLKYQIIAGLPRTSTSRLANIGHTVTPK